MWKKDEATPDAPNPIDIPARRPEPATPSHASPSAPSAGGGAVIGPSITIRGEVSGDEDLLIQGKVDGSVELELHAVTVGGEGRVKANITARVVTVEGEVEGDLKARDQVILRSAARVKGDITAPRVVLEDGANFRGLVDMGEPDLGGASNSVRKSGSTSAGRSQPSRSSGSDGRDSMAAGASSEIAGSASADKASSAAHGQAAT
jgi:cytoskeletal protein CcmA (bactofilin family)